MAAEDRTLACIGKPGPRFDSKLRGGSARARETWFKIELDDLERRAVRKALAGRMARSIEIVGDTTQTISSRRVASIEVKLIGAVLRKLRTNDE